MRDYSDATDEELIVRIRDGETEITDYLIGKYKNLVRQKAKTMFILGGDNDDLIQEGMIGLYKAIRDYDAGRDASFFTFANICVTRQLFSAIEASGRKKHLPLNDYVSFYDKKDEADTELVNALCLVTQKSPEEVLMDRELMSNVDEIMNREMSLLEKQTMSLYIAGYNVREIAGVLGRDEKSTDNALQRAKGKLKKGLQV